MTIVAIKNDDYLESNNENIHIEYNQNGKSFKLHEGDEIWVSADSYDEFWSDLSPGTVLVSENYDEQLINYKLNPGCYFLVSEVTYKYKPKWWEFWKQPIVDGYKLRVWKGKY